MTTKGHGRLIRARKTPLFLIVGGFVLLFGFLFVSEAKASYMSENFEIYEVGQDILALPNWWTATGAPVDYMEVRSIPVYSGSRGTIFNKNLLSSNHNVTYNFKNGDTISDGSFSIAFRTNGTTGSVDGLVFSLSDLDGTTGTLNFGYTLGSFGQIKYKSNNNWFLLGNYTGDTWFVISMEWIVVEGTSAQVRYKLDAGSWTGWLATPTNQKIAPSYLVFTYQRWANTKYWYIDDISIHATCNGTHCQECETWADCENANCVWSFTYNYCFQNEYGCGLGYGEQKCFFCETEVTCEAIEDCYWSEDYCFYGTGACGQGLECQFCEDQTTCETAGCFWYGTFCWFETKPSIFSWTNYYNDYGDYETPSAWVNDVATASQSFFESVGGLLATFKNSFDLQSAYQNGKDFGNAIPIARGYLATLNDFVGVLPIGNFFLFILIFMLAIGVFRMVRALIQLIKFW